MKKMTPKEIKNLPTILHILDMISGEEENFRNRITNSLIYEPLSNRGVENKFKITPETPNGPCVLQPTSSNFNSFFRGQTEYHEYCLPTLYRNSAKDNIDIFINHLRSTEFELLLKTHPFVKFVFDDGIVFKNLGKDVLVKLKVDYLGLAQHYEFDTDLMDFTSDKWVAAFFATCRKENKKYIPMESEGYGIFYRYNDIEAFMNINEVLNQNKKFSSIGLQPFKRPGEQKGFTLKMEEDENLNNVIGIKKYCFQHDKLSAEIIYNRMNQGNSLFPYDDIEEYAEKIKNSKKISNKAFEVTYKKLNFDKLNEETLCKECINKGIKFINYPVTRFSKEYQNKFIRNWKKNGEKEFFSKIITPRFII